MDGSIHYQYRIINPKWYESFDLYAASEDFISLIEDDDDYHVFRRKIFHHVYPKNFEFAKQGWKIHVSATPFNCKEILKIVNDICKKYVVAYKFVLDQQLLNIMLQKIWDRVSSGKFITIYPKNIENFYELIEVLHINLQGYEGPYILSDKRYKDSKVVFYRYGEINPYRILTESGEYRTMIMNLDGELVPDMRMPFWNPPTWVKEPFEDEHFENNENEIFLNQGRYIIESALSFSVHGGVYIGTDLDTGSSVIIKEARPNVGYDSNGDDAVARLIKEYGILKTLESCNIAPKPIDIFKDWEHSFLVEELIDGLDLGIDTIDKSPLTSIYPSSEENKSYIQRLKNIWLSAFRNLKIAHQKGVVLGDISIKNIIVLNDGAGVKFIDFEGSWIEGEYEPVDIFTPGYYYSSKMRRTYKDDIYALGSVMMGCLFPVNSFLELELSAKDHVIEKLAAKIGLDNVLVDLIKTCMDEDPMKRPEIDYCIKTIENSLDQYVPFTIVNANEIEEIKTDIVSSIDYICATYDINRFDRLFPADPMVFFTNPVNVSYGASGVIKALHKINGEIPDSIKSWLKKQLIDDNNVPDGLYVGKSGISWVLWEVGMKEEAIQLFEKIKYEEFKSPELYSGSSGYGLTCLYFYFETNDLKYLQRAVIVANRLIAEKNQNEKDIAWHDENRNSWIGYAKGASGIAYFLNCLSLVSKDDRYMEISREALLIDIGYTESKNEEGVLSTPRGMIGAFQNVQSHYWYDGSAGIIKSLVRYCAVNKDIELLDALSSLSLDLCRGFYAFPGMFKGMSGIGNVLYDLYEFTGDEFYKKEAFKRAEDIKLYKIHNKEGLAYPGEQLLRISTDYATGSAGIILFYNRILNSGKMDDYDFTLDRYLANYFKTFKLLELEKKNLVFE
ncbi:class III lanthionine synthetase LanKC [Paenibacillus lautus]|uniref:class III lanthionine synthetase LanKC n=1 Tax=Paenibacillus lautus TaxID=1401 RepID=UPI003D2A84B9